MYNFALVIIDDQTVMFTNIWNYTTTFDSLYLYFWGNILGPFYISFLHINKVLIIKFLVLRMNGVDIKK